jgi:hypothetical protein
MVRENLGRSSKTIGDIETRRGFEQASAKEERIRDIGTNSQGQVFANRVLNDE